MATYYVRTPEGKIYTCSNPDTWKGCEVLSKKGGEALYKEEYRKDFLSFITPGSKVYTSVVSVAKSGMSRKMKVYVSRDGDICDITYGVSVVTGMTYRDGMLQVSGCGMDMGFHVVYTFGYYLWPQGTDIPHSKRNGKDDTDGGYALKQCWL